MRLERPERALGTPGRSAVSRWRTVLRPDGDAPHLEGKLVAHYHADPLGEPNPVSFDRSKSAVSLGAPLEPRALKHRTRSRAPVGPTVAECPVGNCAPSASTGCDETPRRRRRREGGAMPETAYALYVGIDWGTVT